MEHNLKRAIERIRKHYNKTESEPVKQKKMFGPQKPEILPQTTFIGPEVPEFLKASKGKQKEGGEVDGKEDEEFIGPKPVQEIDEKQSNAEVQRILETHRKDDAFVDPFEILNIDSQATDVDIKKAFWKLSLVVHPDKSKHPESHHAFQILNEAWKKVQSVESRQEWKERKERKSCERRAEMEVKREQRKQEWDTVMHPDMVKSKSLGREEWMTQLPELRRQPQTMKQVNQTSFSRKDYADISQDTSQWTNQYTNQEDHELRIEPPSSMLHRSSTRAPKRPSLLEKHIDKILPESKKHKSNKSHSKTNISIKDDIVKETGGLQDRFQ